MKKKLGFYRFLLQEEKLEHYFQSETRLEIRDL